MTRRRTTRVVAVTNQKGGVAKTTTVASLGAALVERGQRVLLVDLDPQASLTFSLGVDPEELDVSVHQVLVDGLAARDALLTVEDGPDLLPATIELADADAALHLRAEREVALRTALADVVDDYNWVLLDCPPSLGLLTVNALAAAREVLVPMQCETLSHRGLGQLLDTVHDVRLELNRRLRLLGVLPTLFDARTRHSRAVLDDVRERYALPVLEPPIPASVRFAEAPAVGRSVLATARSSKGAAAYRELTANLLGTTHGHPTASRTRRSRRTAAHPAG